MDLIHYITLKVVTSNVSNNSTLPLSHTLRSHTTGIVYKEFTAYAEHS